MKDGINKYLLGLYFLMMFFSSNGQSVIDLKKEKEKASQEIEYINQLLKETNQNAKSSMSRVAMLERKIKLQEKLISNINSELSYLDSIIVRSTQNMDSLDADLTLIKHRYAEMVRYARRNQNANNQLLFLLSAEDFNQAYKRFTYLKQYAEYRKRQVEEIAELQNKLENLVVDLNNRKGDKKQLLSNKIVQSDQYEKQKADQKQNYLQLQKKEKDLKRKLENQQRIAMKLEQEIEKSIADEAKKMISNTLKNSKATKPLTPKPSPEQKSLSDDFSLNKGKLPWPLQRGVITDHFGEHPDLVLKHVIKRNSGIDITTESGARVRAVFKGVVSKVLAIPGGNMTIILRHGSYLTVYSNLASVSVQVGQTVDTKQDLGTVFTDSEDDNKTVLKFQIRHEYDKLDPEKWINT